MKKLILSILTIFAFAGTYSQHAEWLISAGGKHADCGSALTTDNEGNIYVTGSFQGEAKFSERTLFSKGDTDIFLAKYDALGKLLWINQAGSNVTKRNTITEYPTAIASSDEAIYVVGVFAGIADFSNQILTSAGKEDIFLAKYDLNGSLVWVRRAGGNSQDVAHDLSVDAKGNLYLTGYFQKSADFGSKYVTSSHQRESFIVKYSPEGETLWLNHLSSPFYSQGKSLSMDREGVILAGEFAREISVGNHSLKSDGSTDIFIAKYDFEGNHKWSQSFGSTGIDNVNDLAIHENNIYVAGSYLTRSSNNQWRSKGARDGFVSKLSSDGNLIWNQTIGGFENDEAIEIEISDDMLIVAGKFNAEFEYGEEVYLSNGFTDIFLAKMDLNGSYQDIKVMGGTGQDFPTSLVIKGRNILVTGLFRNQLTTTTSASGGSDFFLSNQSLDFNHDNEARITYLMYPNPTENFFWIRSETRFNEIELIYKDGKRIDHKTGLNTNEYKFELDELPSGVYYVRIDGESVKKLIILE